MQIRTSGEIKDPRVLAIDPTSRGFGYAVLEGPAILVDWGVTETTRADNRWVVAHVTERIRRYAPDVLVIEDVSAQGARRRRRVQLLLQDLQQLAQEMGLTVATVSRRQVGEMFAAADATNKEQIADTILGHFSELEASRPPVRKLWMSEDARMAIFDAVGFGLAYFYQDSKPIP